MRAISLLLFVALLSVPAAAQNTQTSGTAAEEFGDLPVPSWGKAVIDSFDKPVHPIIGGIGAGGGIGFGVGYQAPDNDRWYREVEGIFTVRRSWAVQGEFGRRSSSNRSQLGMFGGVRHMNRLDYFGIGARTPYSDRSAFRLREMTFGTRGSHYLMPGVRVIGMAAAYVPDLGRGESPNAPSIENVFSESLVPGGFSTEPVFGRYRGLVEFTSPAPADYVLDEESNSYRGMYQLAVEAVRDHSDGRHNFHRWEAEVQQRIPGLRQGQRLTLHGLLATTNSNADVPYYMLYTLGGTGGLKAFRPDLLGSDGTRATLRGVRNYRFRDRDLVVMQAEYRIPLRRNIHSTVFVDVGQVAPQMSQLFDDLKTSTGFSLSYMRKGRALGRMDVGFGAGEGVHVFWSFGAFQN